MGGFVRAAMVGQALDPQIAGAGIRQAGGPPGVMNLLTSLFD